MRSDRYGEHAAQYRHGHGRGVRVGVVPELAVTVVAPAVEVARRRDRASGRVSGRHGRRERHALYLHRARAPLGGAVAELACGVVAPAVDLPAIKSAREVAMRSGRQPRELIPEVGLDSSVAVLGQRQSTSELVVTVRTPALGLPTEAGGHGAGKGRRIIIPTDRYGDSIHDVRD